ncbi:MAG: M15 family metallopeptidase [Actinomycetota bacterium]
MSGPVGSPWRRGRRIATVAIVVAAAGVTAVVAASPDVLESGATASEQAERTLPPTANLVVVHDSGPLDSSTRTRAIDAAQRAGARFTVVQSVSSAMTTLRRGPTAIQAAAPDFSFPMSTTFIEADAIEALMGTDVVEGLSDRTLVMSAATAALRGARAGDVVTLRHVQGGTRDFTISRIVHDSITGGTELLMLPSAAARLGVQRESRVVIWDFEDRPTIMSALAAAGVVASAQSGPGSIHEPSSTETAIRVRRSWDPQDPDSTLGMASTKGVLGEFSYRVAPDSSWVTIDGRWASANLPNGRVSIGLGVEALCHQRVEPALRAALAEIAARGLAGTIDVDNANAAGGCFAPRFNRLAPDSNVGFLSRHTWAGAIDLNTVRDCQGCDPPSLAFRSGGCETVRIFRKHGFSWGGNYTTPDGMHFEYVGVDRSQLPYPSRYCPNRPTGSPLVLELEQSERAVIFADAGLVEGHAPSD